MNGKNMICKFAFLHDALAVSEYCLFDTLLNIDRENAL